MSAVIRAFEPSDYAVAHALWSATEGVALGPGDAEAEVDAFLRRNPRLSFVAVDGGRALVLACFAALEEAGIRRAQVSAFADNAAARAFWARLSGRLRSDLAVFTLPLRGDTR